MLPANIALRFGTCTAAIVITYDLVAVKLTTSLPLSVIDRLLQHNAIRKKSVEPDCKHPDYHVILFALRADPDDAVNAVIDMLSAYRSCTEVIYNYSWGGDNGKEWRLKVRHVPTQRQAILEFSGKQPPPWMIPWYIKNLQASKACPFPKKPRSIPTSDARGNAQIRLPLTARAAASMLATSVEAAETARRGTIEPSA